LFSLALPVALAGVGVLRGKGNKTIILLGLTFGLVLILAAACGGDETPATDISFIQAVPTETSTPTLLPYMPAYRFATPEVYPEFPDYPVPTPTSVPTSVTGEAQPDTSPVVRLEIPDLKINSIVRFTPFEGLTWPVQGLREDVAWLGNTSWPGLGSNTVLAGHVTVEGLGDGPFRYLENLTTGDEILVYTEESIYTYAVRDQLTVDETDLGVTMPTTNPQLTLITCTGWDTELSLYRFRRVVVADLVSSEAWVRQGSER
jgi:LPXTG-site transpeptidase (sortase) family protein